MEKSESTPSVGRWFGYAALVAFALLSLGPVWIAVKTALTGSNALFGSAGSLLPQDPTLFNFQRVLGLVDPADPRLKKGFIIPARDARQLGANSLFAASKGALALLGSWNINWYLDNAKFDKGFAPLPKGSQGRKSMFNGLADSIWVGSKHKEEAWKWVKFLGSEEGQKIIAGYGVVFPAVRGTAEIAEQVMSKKGADVSPFVQEATDPNGTFLFPIADHAADVLRIMTVALDAILLNGANAATTLKKANTEVNALFD